MKKSNKNANKTATTKIPIAAVPMVHTTILPVVEITLINLLKDENWTVKPLENVRKLLQLLEIIDMEVQKLNSKLSLNSSTSSTTNNTSGITGSINILGIDTSTSKASSTSTSSNIKKNTSSTVSTSITTGGSNTTTPITSTYITSTLNRNQQTQIKEDENDKKKDCLIILSKWIAKHSENDGNKKEEINDNINSNHNKTDNTNTDNSTNKQNDINTNCSIDEILVENWMFSHEDLSSDFKGNR